MSSKFARKKSNIPENPSQQEKSQRTDPQQSFRNQDQRINMNQDEKEEKKVKQKQSNFKNITDGLVVFPEIQNQYLQQDDFYEVKENKFQMFNQAPLETSSYIESKNFQLDIKNGYFQKIDKQQTQKLLLQQQDDAEIKPFETEDELTQFASEFNDFITKCFLFFQGIEPGSFIIIGFFLFNIVFLSIISTDNNDQAKSFMFIGLKINQVIWIVSFLSLLGSSLTLSSDIKNLQFRPVISVIFYGLAFFLNGYNRVYQAKLSEFYDTAATDIDLNSYGNFGIFQVLNIVACITSLLGWFVIISHQKIEKLKNEDQEEKIQQFFNSRYQDEHKQ